MIADAKILGHLNFEAFIKNVENPMDVCFVASGQAGGKICSNYVKAGFYTVFLNTATPDIENLKTLLAGTDESLCKIIKLEGYEGCAKKLEIGERAIQDNAELIETELMQDQRLIDCKYVFIAAGLGGGTGTGSIRLLSEIISSAMRWDKRTPPTEDYPEGKPTVSPIVAYPDSSATQQPLLNAAKTLIEIEELQAEGILGAGIIIDNQKMIDDFMKDKSNYYPDWIDKGNTTTAQLITELAYLAWFASSESLDPEEFIDMFSEPGWISLGKVKFILRASGDAYKKAIKDAFIQPIKKDDKKNYDEIITKAFSNSMLAEDYNYESTKIGGMAVVKHPQSTVFDVKDKINLERAMSSFLDGTLAQVAHFGVYDSTTFGTYTSPNENIDEAIIYTITVIDELPKRVAELTQKALEKEEARQERLTNRNKQSLSDKFKDAPQKQINTTSGKTKRSLQDIMGNSRRKKPTVPSLAQPKPKSNMDDIKSKLKKI